MKITTRPFGQKDGVPIQLYTLCNAAGNEASVSTLGATLTRWTAADFAGRQESIVLGFRNPELYLTQQTSYLNAVVGRYANRIAGGTFSIGEEAFKLSQNEEGNHLHGGSSGFDKKIWKARVLADALEMHYTSPAGEEGYPGTLRVTVCYKLAEDNTLHIAYRATTDAPTLVNLTMHGWFNLSGDWGSTVLDHLIYVNADWYTPVKTNLIPTGEILPVAGTPYDFREPTLLGTKFAAMRRKGFDHNFVLNASSGTGAPAAVILHPPSGRQLEVFTDQPGLQFYTGQGLDGSLKTDSGTSIPKWGALVLEPQLFPDTPNEPAFGNAVLLPGAVYDQNSYYRCSPTLPTTFARL